VPSRPTGDPECIHGPAGRAYDRICVYDIDEAHKVSQVRTWDMSNVHWAHLSYLSQWGWRSCRKPSRDTHERYRSVPRTGAILGENGQFPVICRICTPTVVVVKSTESEVHHHLDRSKHTCNSEVVALLPQVSRRDFYDFVGRRLEHESEIRIRVKDPKCTIASHTNNIQQPKLRAVMNTVNIMKRTTAGFTS